VRTRAADAEDARSPSLDPFTTSAHGDLTRSNALSIAISPHINRSTTPAYSVLSIAWSLRRAVGIDIAGVAVAPELRGASWIVMRASDPFRDAR